MITLIYFKVKKQSPNFSSSLLESVTYRVKFEISKLNSFEINSEIDFQGTTGSAKSDSI